MLVKELRAALAEMPGEMNVYSVDGMGFASAKHIFRGNLVSVEQFCEIRLYTEEHTPQFQDALIERTTGLKDRKALIDDYLRLKSILGNAPKPQTEP